MRLENLFSRENRYWFYFPLSILVMELFVKIAVYGNIFDMGLLYTTLFSICAGTLLSFVCTLFSEAVNRKVTLVLSAVLGLFYCFEYIYFMTFKSFFAFATIGMAGDVLDFWREALSKIIQHCYCFVICLLPFLIMLLFGRRLFVLQRSSKRIKLRAAATTVGSYLLALLIISLNTGAYSDSYYYNSQLSSSDTVRRFGIITTARIDIKQCVFGVPEEQVDNPYLEAAAPEQTTEQAQTTTEKPVEYNELDIDFEKLIANESDSGIKSMHEYFSSVTPSKKNEYTGMFEGKNLIYLTLEGFSYRCIDKTLTPTLYKMATEGFVFNNFYNSLWGGSTASGEYVNMTGNFYTDANCLKNSADNYMPFTLGNMFKGIGYKTYAYHNHTYTYYGRDKSHPNMGYTYKGIGNGLEGLTSAWPRSDREMGDITIKEYIGSEPFHVYYMTVSGHGNYSWSSNGMSVKHRERVEHLPYSENVKAYLACNLEVEDMLTSLVAQLDEAGILEDTVFAMSEDHYPYLLEDSELAELYDLPEKDIHSNFELYKNSFILWSASMDEPVVVDKPCSAIDVLPTLENLFGLDYDSRLLPGTDLLSDSEPVVILNCLGAGGSWHWITTTGSYNNLTGDFTPAAGVDLSEKEQEDYISRMNKIVAAKRTYSMKVLDEDYYEKVLK